MDVRPRGRAGGPVGRWAPRAALEAAIRPLVRCAPCVVGFSGGRDSSALLAVAVALAAREGLDPPVPVSFRFPHAETRESEWQELVVRHLGLAEWARVEIDDGST